MVFNVKENVHVITLMDFIALTNLGVYRLPKNTLLERKIKEVMGKDKNYDAGCQLCSSQNKVR